MAAIALEYESFEIVVVDNSPGDARTRDIAENRNVRYVIEPRRGLSYARNRGVRESTGDIVAFIDDDAVPHVGWLIALTTEFDDPSVAAVCGRVTPLDGAGKWPFTVVGMRDGSTRRIIDLSHPDWFELANFGGIGIGTNMALRRQVFGAWPGFDPRLGRGAAIEGGEESYAFFSLIDRGYRIVYTPSAIVRHRVPSSWTELRAAHLRSLATTSAYVVFLLVVQPRYRGRIIRYAIGGIGSVPRLWRDEDVRSVGAIVPRWRAAFAWLLGPWILLRSRGWR